MNDLQENLFGILSWFHDFCERTRLTYYLAYGTFLGAVRHKGFIPWDDDIDVCMPRKDYEKCKKIFEANGREIDNYYLETPYMEAPDYFFSYNKLYDTKTTMIESARTNCKRGTFLDIFPLDGAGNSLEEGIRYYQKIDFYKSLQKARMWSISKKNSAVINVAILLARMLPGINDKRLSQKIDGMATHRSYDTFDYVGGLLSPYKKKEIMKKDILGSPTLYEFEGKKLYGPERGEEYLEHIYGDWRALPPVEKRNMPHTYLYLNLNEPYIE